MRLCICPCECYEDPDQSDADYEFVEEAEDEIEDRLTGLAILAEETLAGKYGWQTNIITDMDNDQERRIFYEAPGHYAVAQMHDTGLPAESSMANCENRIGHIEIRRLMENLEPWELEAAQKSTGLSYARLSKIFPETRRIQLPTNRTSQIDRQGLVLLCPHCNLSRSEDFMRWLQSGTMSICSFCGMARWPTDQDQDPDFCNFNAGFHNTLEHCHCRCHCELADYYSPTADVDPVFTESITQQALSCVTCNNNSEVSPDDGPTVASRISHVHDVDVTDIPLPHPAETDSGQPARSQQLPIRTRNEDLATLEERARIRLMTGLPRLRFSNDSRLELRRFQNIRMALDDADIYLELESLEVAMRYAMVAATFCDEWTLPRHHPLREEVSDVLCELREMAEEERDTYTSSDIDTSMSND